MGKKYGYAYKTKIGYLTFIEENGLITDIKFGNYESDIFQAKETTNIKTLYCQIEEYLEGKRKKFEISINPEGTEFQKKVWNALLDIPYGTTKSYKDIAEKIGNPNASRAVGMANNKNPIPIIIPCHRVIGSDGTLTGYAGGLDIKTLLLNLERL